MFKNGMRPVHPGEVLKEEFLEPLGMSVNALSTELNVTASRLNDIVRGNRGVTADTAMRLARYFDTTEMFWLNLWSEYELRMAQIHKQAKIREEVKPRVRGDIEAA